MKLEARSNNAHVASRNSMDVVSGHEVWWTVTTNPLIDGSVAKGKKSLNQQGSIRFEGTCSSESKFAFKDPSELGFSIDRWG